MSFFLGERDKDLIPPLCNFQQHSHGQTRHRRSVALVPPALNNGTSHSWNSSHQLKHSSLSELGQMSRPHPQRQARPAYRWMSDTFHTCSLRWEQGDGRSRGSVLELQRFSLTCSHRASNPLTSISLDGGVWSTQRPWENINNKSQNFSDARRLANCCSTVPSCTDGERRSSAEPCTEQIVPLSSEVGEDTVLRFIWTQPIST